MKRHFGWLFLAALQSVAAGAEDAWKRYLIPEHGVELRVPADVRNALINIPGVINTGSGAAHEIAWLRIYSDKYIRGYSHNAGMRISLLTSESRMDEDFAKMFSWREKPSLDLHPFKEERKADLLCVIERIYLRRPQKWETTEMAKVAGHTALRAGTWERVERSKFFQELWAVPLPEGKVLVLHAGYLRSSRKVVEEQRRIVAQIAATANLTEVLQ